jgi:phosphonate degradation associated HDIG domain protein
MGAPLTAADPRTSLDTLLAWVQTLAAQRYGLECVSQLEHALQCAAHAAARGAADELVAACLLHDVGHLVQNDLHDKPAEDHAEVGARFLAACFGPGVTEPIRLHAQAKRFLVATDPIYFGTLSPASVRSLRWQGGAMDAEEADAYLDLPYARDAVALRRWDDAAKDGAAVVPPLATYRALLARLFKPGVAADAG